MEEFLRSALTLSTFSAEEFLRSASMLLNMGLVEVRPVLVWSVAMNLAADSMKEHAHLL